MTTPATGRGRSDGPKRDIIFHSALAERGPVRITVDSEPKFLKNKQRDVVELTIGSDKVLYWSPNKECAEFFRGQLGRTFTVIAEGDKDDATITYVGEAATAGAAPAPPPPPPQWQSPIPASAPAATQAPARGVPDSQSGKVDWIDRFLEGKKHAGRLGVALRMAGGQCLLAAQGFCESNGVKLTPETKTAMVNNIAEAMCQRETMMALLIAMDRGGTVGCLPSVLSEEVLKRVHERVELRKAKAAAPAPPPPPPPPPPTPAPNPDEVPEDDVPY